jgi:hypothetical protein
MNNEQDGLSRRGFLSVGSAALATVAGSLAVNGALAQERSQTDRSKTVPGPSNGPLDSQNPDSMWPPDTDSKSLVRAFKYPFAFANKRTYGRMVAGSDHPRATGLEIAGRRQYAADRRGHS